MFYVPYVIVCFLTYSNNVLVNIGYWRYMKLATEFMF